MNNFECTINSGKTKVYRKRRRKPEEVLHIQIADYLVQTLPDYMLWTTVEISTQQKGKLQQGIQKRKGAMKGWPDLQIFWHDGTLLNVLCLEIKVPGNKPTSIQEAVHDKMRDMNILVEVVYSIEDVEKILTKYGFPHKARILS